MKEVIITQDNIEEIIAKHLDGRASEEETNALMTWRKNKPENERYYKEIKLVNDHFTNVIGSQINVDTAWHKVASKIKKADLEVDKRNDGIFSWKYIGYAASIILLIAAGYFLQPGNEKVSIETSDYSLNHMLEDGSQILLSSNSFFSKISDKIREYEFSGEAQFEIVHNDKDPFVLHLDNILVKDLGTIFDLKAFPGSDTIFIKVSEGLVQFYSLADVGITLEEGEEGMYIKTKNKFYKRTIDQRKAYLTKDFQEATLSEVIDHLAYSFRKDITIENDKIINCIINVDFTKAPYNLVKEIIEETLNITIQEVDQSIILSGEGCN